METKTIHFSFETKAAEEDGTMSFTGYGSVFDVVDAYEDAIKKGAFAKSITEAKQDGKWPAMLSQHGGWGISPDDMTPVGVWTDLVEDEHGLKMQGVLADTARGKELYTLMKMQPRPAINGLSIGYIPIKWENRRNQGEPRRTLTEVKLVEVSLVTFPANGKARVTDVKSDLPIREIEKALRDAGLSRNQAKALLAGGYKALSVRDAQDEDSGLIELLTQNLHILQQETERRKCLI